MTDDTDVVGEFYPRSGNGGSILAFEGCGRVEASFEAVTERLARGEIGHFDPTVDRLVSRLDYPSALGSLGDSSSVEPSTE